MNLPRLAAVCIFALGSMCLSVASTAADATKGGAAETPAGTSRGLTKEKLDQAKKVNFDKRKMRGMSSQKPPPGLCNKACRVCQDPADGGFWCDVCHACYFNVE